VRLTRSSLRIRPCRPVLGACALVTLGLVTACGGAGAAAPTPTIVPSASVAPAVAPSPQRPPLASPVPSPSAVVLAAPTATSTAEPVAGETYEVQSGDTLLTIAREKLGDATQWRRIYDANKDVIGSDPDKLKIGMQLKIPPKQS
jgi:nucleoid-associated protein YgaU